jgi:outer membrane protein OmpA-like peptidoglycan-associated protein
MFLPMPSSHMKHFVFFFILLFIAFAVPAQDTSKIYTKNSDAYRVKEASYNSKRNDYAAVKFFDGVVFTSARARRSKKAKSRLEETFVRLYSTEKTSKGKDKKPKVFMRDLTTKYVDGPVCFNKEFTAVYFSRNHIGSTKKTPKSAFKYQLLEAGLNQNGLDSVVTLPFNSSSYNIIHPSLSNDGSMLFFASDMPGGKGGMDIYFSRKSGRTWGVPINLGPKVNSAGDEMYPFISRDEMLYFASDGHGGMGGLDIFETQIQNDQGKKPRNMGAPINSKFDDFAYHIVSGMGFLSSNRKSKGKDDDIYEVDVLRDIKRGKDALIVTKEKGTNKVLANTTLIINGDSIATNENGEYSLMVEEETVYKLKAKKPDYFDATDEITSASSPDEQFTRAIQLEKDPKLFLIAVINDAQNDQPIEGVTVKIKDLSAKTELGDITTASNGRYTKALKGKRIGDKLDLLVILDKPGYLQKTVTVNYTVNKPGEIILNDLVNLSVGRVAVGMDLSKMIEIKPIYFDLGKPTIRPDAALELDKIVAIMTKYPTMSIELGSHTDCRSAAGANLKLSGARAKASAAYIVAKGIAAGRIKGKGYGETKLLNSCACEGKIVSSCSEEEHTKNRRTEFVITKLQ